MRFALLLAGSVLVPTLVGAQISCPSPAPPAGIDPTSMSDRGRILQYARSLAFQPAASPTGETRPLTVVSTPGTPAQRRFRLSVDAAAQPESCAHRNTLADLSTGRIVSMQTMSGAYDKLRLPGGVSYLWIDRLEGTTARGVIIPGDMTTDARVVTIRIDTHDNLPPRSFAEARWLFNPMDDELWVSCSEKTCCIIIEGDP